MQVVNGPSRRLLSKWKLLCNLGRECQYLSTCKRAKVGCIIFPWDASAVLSFGYNGPASGLDNDSCIAEAGRCGCAHAEANAMIKALPHDGPIVVFSTMTPCASCAPLLVNWAARRVALFIYDEVYMGPGTESSHGLKIIRLAGIECVQARDVLC